MRDCPSSSWLLIRVGAFFSSFSYTNSSSRTSETKKLNYASHETTVTGKAGKHLSWLKKNFNDISQLETASLSNWVLMRLTCRVGGLRDMC